MIEVPERLIAAIDATAREVLGSADREGQALAREVARVSEVYTRRREEIATAATGPGALAARLRFFLPRDLPKVIAPLEELRRAGALPARRTWRVLDLGAGLGTTTLGAALFATTHDVAGELEVLAIDHDAQALRILRALAARTEEAGLARVTVETRTADVRSVEAGGPYDLILLGLVVNELGAGAAERAAMLRQLAGTLSEDGSIIVIEPALRETSRALHAVRDAIVAAGAPPNVFAPCLRGGGCPMLENERDWCHEDIHVALPAQLAEVARAAGLRFERLTYSYLTLRRDGRTLRDAVAPGSGAEPWRVVSGPMPSKGKLELFACGAPGRVRLVRLDRHKSEENARLDRADRGDVLRIRGAADERKRLRIDRDTPVEG